MAEFPPERTLFEEAKSAFDELIATQDEFERVAEELAGCTDETKRKQLRARYDRLTELLRHHDAFDARSQGRAGARRPRLRVADFHREVRDLHRRPADAGSCSPSCCSPPRT